MSTAAPRLRFWITSSRPGLWFPTVWLYLLPLGGSEPWGSLAFWVGLLHVTLPLNLLVYGWNDLVDRETDRLNPRKGNALFGAKGDDAELASLPWAMGVAGTLGFGAVALLDGPRQLGVAAGTVAVCWLYNREPGGWRGRPPLELLCQIGYLLVVPLSAWLNDAPLPPLATWAYLALFTAQAQLMGEVMDVDPDQQAGRRTTATELGVKRTKGLIVAVVATEAALAFWVFHDALFAGALLAFVGWLLLDLFVLFGERRYSLGWMKALGVISNGMALITMVYVWRTGCLL